MAIEIEQLHLPWPAWVWVDLELREDWQSGIRKIINTWQDGILGRMKQSSYAWSVNQEIEDMALTSLSNHAYVFKQSGGRTELTKLHREMLKYDRATKMYGNFGQREMERLRWIAINSGMFTKMGRRKVPDLQRTKSWLEHAEHIVRHRDILGLPTVIADMKRGDFEQLHRRYLAIAA